MNRLRVLGQRWPWLDRALDVHERVGEVNGGFIASGITVSVFLSLFPLILLVTAVVGYLAVDDPNVAKNIIDALGLKPRKVMKLLYVAIEGRPAGLPLFDSMHLLGREVSLDRLRAARLRIGDDDARG